MLISPRTGSALALLYGTQNTMEQHHFNHAVMILNSEVREDVKAVDKMSGRALGKSEVKVR